MKMGYRMAALGLASAVFAVWPLASSFAQEHTADPVAKDAAPAKVDSPAKSDPPAAKEANPPAAEPKAGEDKTKRATPEKAEKARVKRVIPPGEAIRRPGAPRPGLPNFRDPNPLPFKEPSKETQQQFDDLKGGKVKPSPNDTVIDTVAKYYVFRLTDPKNEPSKLVDEAVRAVAGDRNVRAKTADFIEQYRRAIAKYVAQVLDNSVLVKVNALNLLQRLLDLDEGGSVGDAADPVDVFLKVLEDPRQEDAVFYVALRGLDVAKDRGTLRVQKERPAVKLILDRTRASDVQPVLFDQMIDTLGKLGHAFEGADPTRAEVGTFLAKVVADPDIDLRTRLRAAVALGSLRTGEVEGWNYELQGLLLAQMLVDLVRAGEDAKINPSSEVYKWLVFKLGTGLTNIFRAASADPDIDELIKVADPILAELVKKGAAPNLEPLREWIEKHKVPKSAKLARGAAEIPLSASGS